MLETSNDSNPFYWTKKQKRSKLLAQTKSMLLHVSNKSLAIKLLSFITIFLIFFSSLASVSLSGYNAYKVVNGENPLLPTMSLDFTNTFPVQPPLSIINNAPAQKNTLKIESRTKQEGEYTVAKNTFYKNGQKIYLHGVSWFGFEDKGFLAHGLWSRSTTDIVNQIKSLGFNAVRLPFCPPILKNPPAKSIDYIKNPDLIGKGSLEVMDSVIQELDRQGVHILLDIHNFDCTNNLHPLWYTSFYSEDQLIKDWSFVVDRYKNIDHIVGADIKNEPHDENGVFASWGTGNIKTDWKLAAERIGQALLKINPKMLIFVQGIANLQTECSDKFGHFWGGNLAPANCFPIDNSKIPANKMVYNPHVYGPDVSPLLDYFRASDYPNNLPPIWDKHFGFLVDKGYTVSIGEFGGKYGHNDKYGKSDPRDKAWQNKFVDYMIEKKLCNYFYWSLNPDSTDTGGLLQADWLTPHQDKVDNLNRLNNSCN